MFSRIVAMMDSTSPGSSTPWAQWSTVMTLMRYPCSITFSCSKSSISCEGVKLLQSHAPTDLSAPTNLIMVGLLYDGTVWWSDQQWSILMR